MTPLANRTQPRRVRALQILFCSILLILALQVPGYAEERRSLTVSPGAGPVGTKVTVRGTGWDPKYYASGVQVGFYQNFGNGVLTPIADKTVVPPDSAGRFTFNYTIPEDFRQGDVLSISGLIGNGGGERANFTVTGGRQEGGGSAVTGPDLQPTAIKYDASTIRSENTLHFDAGIKNNGQKKTRSFNVKWVVDGKDVGAYGSHAGIPGETSVLDGNSQFDWTPKNAGTHEITFTVDTDNHVAETKESNNSQRVTVTVEGSKSTLAFEYPLRGGDHAPSYAGYDVANEGLKFIDEYKDKMTCYGGNGHRMWQLRHAGEDWFRKPGTPVYAVAKGEVFLVTEWQQGDAIIIEHQLPTQQAWGSDKNLLCLPLRR
jgi:CARDB